ncbi:uncharacterized protein LOC107619430 isoform X1 [Arachis ipaensis]|uniref:uncharacterized protein LOC107619430 isoform X1 n=1 Tax=Arachis ipaensis TaxID=130454 RepID=UPI000A2B15AC|nr:uncharacterized protein LOC107619430 isoform X1 [Arachis ipaensis]
MEGSAYDLRLGAPHELDLTDLDHSMNRLNLSVSSSDPHHDHAPPQPQPPPPTSISDDVINHVDQFLRDAIHNPRERLSVLRIEEDIEKFIDDPSQQQLEFHRLPTSYLRLAAHRVAQHYSLPSMVLVDNTSPDGSGSRIIIHKTSECKMPLVRLADIPVKLSSEDNPAAVMKVAIKQRPNKQIQILGNANSNSVKSSNSKSMEERKDEYNRARERIFSSSSNGAIVGGKPECDLRKQDKTTVASLGVSRVEGKAASVAEINYCRGLVESSTNCSRSRSRTEKEQVGRYSQHNRVAIFRDREVDRKDPDYNRSYDRIVNLTNVKDDMVGVRINLVISCNWHSRYMQRFDPGFGFNGGFYAMQPMYTSVVNYNTEFPQLGSTHGPQLSSEHHSQPLLQHIPGPWAPPSIPGVRYGHPDTIMPPFNPSHFPGHSTMHLHSSQYSRQQPVPFIHHDPVHQPFAQYHQLPPDACFGLTRPR